MLCPPSLSNHYDCWWKTASSRNSPHSLLPFSKLDRGLLDLQIPALLFCNSLSRKHTQTCLGKSRHQCQRHAGRVPASLPRRTKATNAVSYCPSDRVTRRCESHQRWRVSVWKTGFDGTRQTVMGTQIGLQSAQIRLSVEFCSARFEVI